MKMRRQTPNQKAEADSKRFSPRRITSKTITIAAICLSFAQAAIAATGTVNFNDVNQQIEGFGGAIVYDAPDLNNYTDKNTVYDLLFSDLGIEFVRIRNCVGYDDSSVTATKNIIAAARELNRTPGIKLEMVPWSPPASCSSGARRLRMYEKLT
jgi:O-glycosyl hydrolase